MWEGATEAGVAERKGGQLSARTETPPRTPCSESGGQVLQERVCA